MITKARCTTTSAPSTSPSSAARSSTSPRRYSVLRRPAAAGSNGRRAIATIRSTSRQRSSARSSERPMSPVGPVTATVMRLGRPAPSAAPRQLALGDPAEAPDLGGVGAHHLQLATAEARSRRRACAGSAPSRPRRNEVAAHLEVLLPGEVGRRARARSGTRVRAGAGRRGSRPRSGSSACAPSTADGHAHREREAVGRDDREHRGRVARSRARAIRSSHAAGAADGSRRGSAPAPRSARSGPPPCGRRTAAAPSPMSPRGHT